MMDNLTMWSLVVGFLSPAVIAILQRPTWSKERRTLLAAAFSIVGGLVTAWLGGELDGAGVTTAVLTVAVATITFYKGLWQPAGVAQLIENATSPAPPKATASLTCTAPDANSGPCTWCSLGASPCALSGRP